MSSRYSIGEFAKCIGRSVQTVRRWEHEGKLQAKRLSIQSGQRIAQGSRNGRLIAMLCNDLYFLTRMYRYQFGMSGDRSQAALDEHGLSVEAIADHDGESAEWLTRRHIRASRRHAKQRLSGVHPPARRTT